MYTNELQIGIYQQNSNLCYFSLFTVPNVPHQSRIFCSQYQRCRHALKTLYATAANHIVVTEGFARCYYIPLNEILLIGSILIAKLSMM